jgi:hypothetical protein
MSSVRSIVALLALGLLGWLLWQLFGTAPERAPATPHNFQSSAECQSCHAEVYAEWSASEHAGSWTGPQVRALSLDFSNQDCIDCHAPQPVFATGIGQRVLPRTLNRVDGVDCLSCHARADGRMAGGLTDESVACRPVESRELVSVEHCAGCHNQHQTVDQWRGSRYAEQGIDCLDCHMPPRGGDPSRGRDHTMHGGTSLAELQRAVELRGELEGQGWVAVVENVGAGHSFPTDERSRAADLFWRPLDAAGSPQGPWRHFYRFRSPYRHETELAVTLLEVHEVRRIPVLDGPQTFLGSGPQTSGTPVGGPIEVGLFYLRAPYYQDPTAPDPEAEAVLVQSVRLVE